MKETPLTEDLRGKINKYLMGKYGCYISSDRKTIVEERRDYIYADPDNNNIFYIPKKSIV